MEITYSPLFEKEIKALAKKYRSIAQDFAHLLDSLQKKPTQGTSLGEDCYKIRMAIASKNKGKSGGARIITCIKIVQNRLYFLSIYDKSDKEDIEDKELDAVLKSDGLKP
jgi:hypothetical protein